MDDDYAIQEAQRKKEDAMALDHPVTVDGHKLKLRDIFPEAHQARDFKVKLRLLNSKAGGEPDGSPKAPKTKEDIADELFDPVRNPVGMDGE